MFDDKFPHRFFLTNHFAMRKVKNMKRDRRQNAALPNINPRLFKVFLIGTLGLAGCRSGITNIPVAPDSETGQAIRKMDYMAAHGGLKPEDEATYRAKAVEFIRYAQAGDVEQMLKITSLLSYATQTNSLRSLYAEQVVPQFTHTEVTWEAHGKPNIDEQKNIGLVFTGTAQGATTFSFDVAVAKENGMIVILGVRNHH
jgi:hypothetical protein